MSEFEQRYCAFIDILGFKQRVRSLEESWDQEAFDRLRSCLRFMHEEQSGPSYGADLPIYVQDGENIIEKELGDPRLTYISDCLIISTNRDADGFKALCYKASKIWTDLLWDGYMCRGAISAGPLIHEPSCITGSAYMRAFELEATASYPRIIIDKRLEEIYSAFPGKFPVHPPTIDRADDDYLYLRYFPFKLYPPYVPTWSDFFLRAKDVIERGLKNSDASIRAKYARAASEFNFALDTYRPFIEDVVTSISHD